MRTSAGEDVAVSLSATGVGEERNPYSFIEDYIERLEEKTASKEGLGSYEYHSLIASLLA